MGGLEGRAGLAALGTVWNCQRDLQRPIEQLLIESEPNVEAAGNIPAVYDVVDEVEPDRLFAWKGGERTDLGKGEFALEHAVLSERSQDAPGPSGVRADRIGTERLHGPERHVAAISSRSRSEPIVLHGHMRKQIAQVPVAARRRPSEIVRVDAGHHGNAGSHRPCVQVEKIGLCHAPSVSCRATGLARYHRLVPMIKSDVETSDDVTAAVCLFRSLADPARLAILRHLALGEHRVVELTAHLGLAQSTVSAHLACLRDCGLVSSRPQGRASVFALTRPELFDLFVAAEAVLAATGDPVALCPNYGELTVR